MPASTNRPAARLAVPILLALLVGGCADQQAASTAASTTAASTTTVAQTTTTIPPLNAEERAWLKGVAAVRAKVEKSFEAGGSGTVTRAIMLESSRKLAAWSRQLRRLGTPSDRLQPAYTLVRKAIRTYDKGAKCYARAAGAVTASGAVVAGTPEERIVNESLDCAGAAEGNGTNLLYKADAKAEDLKAKYD
ncbi:MAG TPA: hypothetical protein VFN05_13300 [Actinomycetes bacterium]|nr:hypothetical protein [Actinomycetes bacterium]